MGSYLVLTWGLSPTHLNVPTRLGKQDGGSVETQMGRLLSKRGLHYVAACLPWGRFGFLSSVYL